MRVIFVLTMCTALAMAEQQPSGSFLVQSAAVAAAPAASSWESPSSVTTTPATIPTLPHHENRPLQTRGGGFGANAHPTKKVVIARPKDDNVLDKILSPKAALLVWMVQAVPSAATAIFMPPQVSAAFGIKGGCNAACEIFTYLSGLKEASLAMLAGLIVWQGSAELAKIMLTVLCVLMFPGQLLEVVWVKDSIDAAKWPRLVTNMAVLLAYECIVAVRAWAM